MEYYLLPFGVMMYMLIIGTYSMYKKPREQAIGVASLTGLVCYISAVCGMFGATENNQLTLADGRRFLFCKFGEWTANNPLLCCIMCNSYGVCPNKTLRLATLTAGYCLCGVGAVLTSRLWMKLYFLILGCLMCAIVTSKLYVISLNPPTESRVATVNLWMMILVYPMYVCTWSLSPDVFGVIDTHQEYIAELVLMCLVKTCALLYVVGDQEWLSISNCIWELPGHLFFIARSVVYRH